MYYLTTYITPPKKEHLLGIPWRKAALEAAELAAEAASEAAAEATV